MISRKFDVSFDHAHFDGTSVEVVAKVHTDNGVSHKSGRYDRDKRIWKEMGRVYTDVQTAKVATLLDYYEPIAIKAKDDFLAAHNFSVNADTRLHMTLNDEMVVTYFNYSVRK